MTAATEGRGNEERARGVVVHLAAVAIAHVSPEQGAYTDAMAVIIRDALDAAEKRGFRRGVEEARRKIDSVRFERYAVAEPGAAYKWQAALELADDVRALAGGGK